MTYLVLVKFGKNCVRHMEIWGESIEAVRADLAQAYVHAEVIQWRAI